MPALTNTTPRCCPRGQGRVHPRRARKGPQGHHDRRRRERFASAPARPTQALQLSDGAAIARADRRRHHLLRTILRASSPSSAFPTASCSASTQTIASSFPSTPDSSSLGVAGVLPPSTSALLHNISTLAIGASQHAQPAAVTCLFCVHASLNPLEIQKYSHRGLPCLNAKSTATGDASLCWYCVEALGDTQSIPIGVCLA